MPYGNYRHLHERRSYIHLDGEKSVAIGGRTNDGSSYIRIRCKELVIEQMGKKTLGIGSLLSGADVDIDDSRVFIEHHSKAGLGIGSFSDPCRVSIKNGCADFKMSATR